MISIPIPESARQTAKSFAQEQTQTPKVKQVYLNTLAVYAVNNYLQMLDIATDLEASYSWNNIGRLCANVADLHITNLGHLECRPIRNGEQICEIPPEVWENRLGYVVVQLDQSCKEAKILGFLPSVKSSILEIKDLQPLSALLEHFQNLQIVNLRQWLIGIYKNQWRDMNELFNQKSPALAFRSKQVRGINLDNPNTIKQTIQQLYKNYHQNLPNQAPENIDDAQIIDVLVQMLQTTDDEELRWTLAEILWTIKPNHYLIQARRVLDLGLQLAGYAVALMVAILPKPDQTLAVLLRLYPLNNKPYLPAEIKLSGLYTNGEPFLEVQSRNQDDYIQLKFSAEIGERFSVKVSLNDASIIENFVS